MISIFNSRPTVIALEAVICFNLYWESWNLPRKILRSAFFVLHPPNVHLYSSIVFTEVAFIPQSTARAFLHLPTAQVEVTKPVNVFCFGLLVKVIRSNYRNLALLVHLDRVPHLWKLQAWIPDRRKYCFSYDPTSHLRGIIRKYWADLTFSGSSRRFGNITDVHLESFLCKEILQLHNHKLKPDEEGMCKNRWSREIACRNQISKQATWAIKLQRAEFQRASV